MPAGRAARSPAGSSSNTTQFAGSAPIALAALRKISGVGLAVRDVAAAHNCVEEVEEIEEGEEGEELVLARALGGEQVGGRRRGDGAAGADDLEDPNAVAQQARVALRRAAQFAGWCTWTCRSGRRCRSRR